MALVGIVAAIFSRNIRRSIIRYVTVLAVLWLIVLAINAISIGNPDAVNSQATTLEQYQERPAQGDLCNNPDGSSGVIVWDKTGPGYSCNGPAPAPPVP
jgi:hypothetical protein